jgi:arylsulfatase A-like enzyme
MYDIITRAPLIVWGPNYFSGGRRVDHLCQQFDIAPVIFHYAGLTPPADWEAKSLMPYIEGESDEPLREYVFAEQIRDGILTGTDFMTMVRSKDWKLVHYLDDKNQGELYNLKDDPGEHRNLWYDESFQEKKKEMEDVLLRWRMYSDISTQDKNIEWR